MGKAHTYRLKNGKEALDFIEENCEKYESDENIHLRPDLIFIDMNMPVMDGIEFLEEFYNNKNLKKEYREDTCIYMLTSSDNPIDKEKITKYNIRGYISKPMTTDKLISIVK